MFQPWSFSPLVLRPALWLDASDASTLWDATSGGSLTAADGAVARWEDKSGNARHATQATGVSQPLRKTSIQNGRDVVRFDGVNDTMTHTLSAAVTSVTIFAVTKKITAQTGYRSLIAIGPNSNSGALLLSRNATSGRWGTFSSTERPANTDAGTASFRLLSLVDNAASGGGFYFNGSADGTWAANSLGQTNTHIGGDVAFSQCTNSDIAEILVFLTALSTTDRQAVELYLNTKWAIY